MKNKSRDFLWACAFVGALLFSGVVYAGDAPDFAGQGMKMFADIDMNDENIYNATEIHADYLYGDCSNCTGIAGAGETNTASNIGSAGVGVYDQKVGVDLQFRNVNAGSSKITITDDGANDEIDIDVAPGNINTADLNDDNTYVKVAGETMTGALNHGGYNVTNAGNLEVDNEIWLTSGNYLCLDADCNGYIYYNGTHTIIGG